MGHVKQILVAVVLITALAACRGEPDAKRTARPAARASTTTTLATQVMGVTLDAPTSSTAAPATPTRRAASAPTTASAQTRGASVDNAPREAHTQRSDNAGSLEYGASPAGASSRQDLAEDDPLEFFVGCQVAADGHGTCNVDLVNRVRRNAVFPDGLKITLTMQRHGAASPVVFEFAPGNISSLRPGEQAHVEGTFDLTERGRYDYFATTTVAWP